MNIIFWTTILLYIAQQIVVHSIVLDDDLRTQIESDIRENYHAVGGIERDVISQYQMQPDDPVLNNMMGFIAYVRENLTEATKYYRKCCEYDHFTSEIFINHWLHVTAADIPTHLNALKIVTNHTSSQVFYLKLIEFSFSNRLFVDYYSALTQSLDLFSQEHDLWIEFVMLLDVLRSTDDDAVNNANELRVALAPFIDSVVHERLLLLGLSIFPRSPSLLYGYAVWVFKNKRFDKCSETIVCDAVMMTNDTMQATLVDLCASYDQQHMVTEDEQTVGVNSAVSGREVSVDRYCDILSPHHLYTSTAALYSNASQLPALQIGCSSYFRCARKGWLIADALPSISTHFVTPADDLSILANNSIRLVYSSHTLEHLSTYMKFNDEKTVVLQSSETERALTEWNRILEPGGELLISVPDVEILFSLFINATDYDRIMLHSMIFGGQDYEYNFHKSGFYFAKLEFFLRKSNFCDIRKVDFLQMGFEDASLARFKDQLISLSVKAVKCV